MSEDNRIIPELPEIQRNQFSPQNDRMIYSRTPREGEEIQFPTTKLIRFNDLMNEGKGFAFKGDLFKWNVVKKQITDQEMLPPRRFAQDDGSHPHNLMGSSYYYFDIKVADITTDLGSIPDNATYILFTMDQVNLEISDLRGTVVNDNNYDAANNNGDDALFNPDENGDLRIPKTDAYGWTKFESSRKNFVFENMQYPVQRIFPIDAFTVDGVIPHAANGGKNHSNMNPENHACFRCPLANKNDQNFMIYAWSY